jgi:PadR family transcriptional regulator, regulatory protein PadR
MQNYDMKGYLSFLILWLLHKEPMSGAILTKEIEKRKGSSPSPGTIYPALKELKKKTYITEFIGDSKDKRYTLTSSGRDALDKDCKAFCSTFYDMKDILDAKNEKY